MFAALRSVNTPWLVGLAFLWPGMALAHAGQGGFVLLLPTGIYTAAGVVAVGASILLVTLLPARFVVGLFRPVQFGRLPRLPVAPVTSLATLAFLGWLIVTGLYGPRDPLSNLLPLTIWTLWWIGFVTLQGVFGDLWSWANPFTGVHRLIWGGGAPPLRLPAWLGHWPAVVAFLLVVSFALADPAPDDPARLALFVLGYACFTLVGCVLFGPRVWLARGECLSLLLTLFARLSPLRWCPRLTLGLPGWRAVRGPVPEVSLAVFILILLGSGSFDGLNETFWWLARIGINPLAFPGRSEIVGVTTLGLLGANLALIAAFAACIWAGRALVALGAPGGVLPGWRRMFGQVSLSVLPIAFGYHIAHFLTSFMVNGQYALAALTDPFARGDDFLGLGQFYVTTGFFNTRDTVRAIWLTQAGVIVAAHVTGVLMAHALALRLFGDHRRAVLSQIPLALFMVLYTLLGLWLLAAPRGA